MSEWVNQVTVPYSLVILGIIGAGFGFMKSNRIAGILGSIVALLGASWVILGIVTTTEGEIVQAELFQLGEAFEKGDKQATLGFFSDRCEEKETIKQGLNMIARAQGVSLKEIKTSFTNEASRAITEFRANGEISVAQIDFSQWVTTRWKLTWQKESEKWKVIRVERLGLTTNQPEEILSVRE